MIPTIRKKKENIVSKIPIKMKYKHIPVQTGFPQELSDVERWGDGYHLAGCRTKHVKWHLGLLAGTTVISHNRVNWLPCLCIENIAVATRHRWSEGFLRFLKSTARATWSPEGFNIKWDDIGCSFTSTLHLLQLYFRRHSRNGWIPFWLTTQEGNWPGVHLHSDRIVSTCHHDDDTSIWKILSI